MSVKRGREGPGDREHVGGVKGIWRMGDELDSHLGDVTTFSVHVLHERHGSFALSCPCMETPSAPGHAFHLHLISSKAYCQESASHK